jgi:hypothetical protein
MDIQSVIKQFSPALIQQLTLKSGFTPQQAQSFVPGLISQVIGALKGGGFDVKSILGGDASSLISKLDVAALAKPAGIDGAKAETGAKEVVPSLLKQLQSQSGGLEGLLGQVAGKSGGTQELLKKAGKLFHST